MATKLYLHNQQIGASALPLTEQSTLTAFDNFETAQDRNRKMNTTIGTAQVSVANTSDASTTARDYYALRFVSDRLNQTSVAANTWTLNFAASEANAAANFPCSGTNQPIYINCYVWRPSTATKVGTILDGNSASVYDEPAVTTEVVMHGTFSGSSIASVQAGDVIVLEMWFRVTQAMATAYAQTIFFDGTTENTTENAAASNHASYLETPENLVFETEPPDSDIRSIITATNSAQATTAGATEYWWLSNAHLTKSSTETDRQAIYRTPGTLSRLWIRITANTTSAASTVRIRKNAANGTMSITIPAAVTGIFEAPYLTDSVSAGDKFCVQSVSGGTGTLSFTIIQVQFESNTAGEALSKPNSASFNIVTNGTRFVNITGPTSTGTGETDHSSKLQKAVTAKNLWVNVLSNARTTATTVTIRKSVADTSITLTINAGETGFKEDTSNTASFAAGDNITFKHVAGTGAETLTLIIGCELVSSAGSSYIGGGGSTTQTINAALSQFIYVGGIARDATEANVRQRAGLPFKISEMTMSVTANTITANSVFTLRKNGVDTALSIVYGNAETGFKTDSSDIIDVLATDELSIGFTTGATGTSMTLRQIGFWNTLIALTAVSKESIQIYNLRKLIGPDSTQKWNIRKELFKESTQRFALRNSRSKEITEIFAIRKAATGLSTQLYNIRSFVFKESTQRFNVRKIASKESTQIYLLRNSRSKESTQRFNIRKIASQVSTQIFRIRSFIFKESTQRFNIRKVINKESTHIYAIRKAAVREISQLYNVRKIISKDVTQIFRIRNIRSKESIQIWNERQSRSKEATQLWNIRKIASRESTQLYSLEGLFTVFREVTQIYNIRNIISKESSQRYAIRIAITKESIQIYNILQALAKEVIQLYSIRQHLSKESTQSFNVRKIVSLESIQRYNIALAVTSVFRELTQIYNIRKIAAKEVSQVWNLRSRVSRESIQLYGILLSIFKESSQLYSVRKIISKDTTQLWNIRKTISKESIQLYTLQQIGAVSREIIQIYNIQKTITKESIQRWSILQTLSRESLQRYSIRKILFKETTQLYQLRKSVTKESTQLFNILKTISKESIQKYNIALTLTSVFRELTQIYNIRQIASKESTQRYNLLKTIAKESTQIYTILLFTTTVFREITQRYAIRQLAKAESIQRYDIRKTISRISSQLYSIAEREVWKPIYNKQTKRAFQRWKVPNFTNWVFDRSR